MNDRFGFFRQGKEGVQLAPLLRSSELDEKIPADDERQEKREAGDHPSDVGLDVEDSINPALRVCFVAIDGEPQSQQ